jgi:hypothetical protein
MASPPESTKTSLRQRLQARARDRWPQLASKDGYEKSILPSGYPAGTPEEALDCLRPLPQRAHRLAQTPDELTGETTR